MTVKSAENSRKQLNSVTFLVSFDKTWTYSNLIPSAPPVNYFQKRSVFYRF